MPDNCSPTIRLRFFAHLPCCPSSNNACKDAIPMPSLICTWGLARRSEHSRKEQGKLAFKTVTSLSYHFRLRPNFVISSSKQTIYLQATKQVKSELRQYLAADSRSFKVSLCHCQRVRAAIAGDETCRWRVREGHSYRESRITLKGGRNGMG